MPDRLIPSNALDLLVATPLHLLALLVLLTILAFRAPPGARLRPWRIPLLLLSGWVWLSTTPVVVHGLLVRLESTYPPLQAEDIMTNDAVVVVLAGGEAFVESSPDALQLNLATLRRTITGAEVQRRTGGELLMVGSVKGESVPVAMRMAQFAAQLEADEALIRALPGSLNTYQNIEQLPRDMLGGKRVYLVTSAAHMRRAMAVARKQGIEAIPVMCDFRGKRSLGWRAWLPDNDSWNLMRMTLHEYVGILYYRWRGWV